MNTDLPSILHRFHVMADYWSNFRYWEGSASLQHSRWRWFPASIAINDIALKTTFYGVHFCRNASVYDVYFNDIT